ncbi:pyridoxal kinase PdxY [Fluviispira multicolorata]|uniref:pyridoxal kinase n=1 Tax=Fluviispira multicolorata TaxID=2654512 RepID=A0A833N5N8_9BACT|nr:pyridoxal kinase PdxY [Fluviispira multicolorata]KAB8028136.1 pyridoxal kinase PdxY [Fluviispira multicolorata]
MNQIILSIQSCVSYGHVGNSAVTFPLQRLGVQVWPIHTVLFSNHTGYGQWRGKVIDVEGVREVFLGIKDRGVLKNCDALLSGYMGSKELGNVMIEAINELRKVRPETLYCCDPVMGDIGRGFFVKEGIPEFFKEEMIQYADIITPNHFELEYLSDQKFDSIEGAIEAAQKVMQKGPKVVVITSLLLKETKETNINMLVISENSVYIATTPYISTTLNGTGDITSALFTHFYLKFDKNIAQALEATISRVYAIIQETYQASSKELLLVQAQDSLINPNQLFKAKKINF